MWHEFFAEQKSLYVNAGSVALSVFLPNCSLISLVKNCQKFLNSTKPKILYQAKYDPNQCNDHYFSPTLIEIENLDQLEGEVFDPILHIIRYRSDELDNVINAVNATGYGLTLGIHSRINETIQKIQQRVKVGNIYINRDMIGAVVGVTTLRRHASIWHRP